MPCVILEGDEQDLLDSLPPSLSNIHIRDIRLNTDTSKHVIMGTIAQRWPLQATHKHHLLKVLLQQDRETISIYFIGKFATDCDKLQKGDHVAMCNVTVEKNTRVTTGGHLCQILVDDKQQVTSVWLLRRKSPAQGTNRSPSTNPNAVASTSTSTGSRQMQHESNDDMVATCNIINRSNTKEVSPSKQKPNNKPVRSYVYTQLKDLVSGTTVNVFGVVKFLKKPTMTKGSDYCMVVSLVDPSLRDAGSKLKCLLFARSVQQLECIKEVGDIVRMHRLKITTFNDELQGQMGSGFACLAFDGQANGSNEPRSSTENYTLTAEDLKMVDTLRDWHQPELDENDSLLTLSQVSPGQYFNLVCQVVATCLLNSECVLLRVWDGTKVNFPTSEKETEEDVLVCDLELARRSSGYNTDLLVFDDHVPDAVKVQPGDYVCLYNLHAANHTLHLLHVEFCLHAGTAYGRRLVLLPPAGHATAALKQRLALIPSPVTATSQEEEDSCGEMLTNDTLDELLLLAARAEDEEEMEHSDRRVDSQLDGLVDRNGHEESRGESHEVAPSEVDRCLLRTATVISGRRHHIRHSTLKDVQQARVPAKFRIIAEVLDYQPRVSQSEDFVRLYCARCHFVATVREMRDQVAQVQSNTASPRIDQEMESGNVHTYHCPQCSSSQSVDDRSSIPCAQQNDVANSLEYIYALRLLLRDDSGWQVVQLWREDAIHFLHGFTPEKVLLDSALYEHLRQQLVALCPPSGATTRPCIECCLKSYSTPNGVCYQIFDTTLTDAASE